MNRRLAGHNKWIELDPRIKARVTGHALAWAAEKAASEASKGNSGMKKAPVSQRAFFDNWAQNGVYRVN